MTKAKRKDGFSFNQASRAKLAFAHPELQNLFLEAIQHVDCSILCSYRSNELQDEYYRTGFSKKKGGESKHNRKPSDAVDVIPYPVDWRDRERFCYFAGIVMGIALKMGIKIRWGGDWDQDNKTQDETFSDMAHFERDVD